MAPAIYHRLAREARVRNGFRTLYASESSESDALVGWVGGDMLVVRLGGNPGTRQEHRRTLASLGLTKIGHVVIGRRDDGCFWGQVQKVKHLVLIVDLYGEATDRTDPRGSVAHPSPVSEASRQNLGAQSTGHRAQGGDVTHPEAFDRGPDESGRHRPEGHALTYGPNDYVQVESTADQLAIMWTSQGDVTDILKRFINLYGAPTFAEGTVAYREGAGDRSDDEVEADDLPSDAVLSYVYEHDKQITYCRLALQNSTVAWQRRPRQDSKGLGGVSWLVVPRYGTLDHILDAIRATGTPTVSERSQDIVQLLSAA